MKFRYLGNSGLKVSEICYGNWLTHGSQVENEVATRCVETALEVGITSFDTADVYAQTGAEAVLGKALAGEGIKIWGDGETIRDYIYVDDLMELAMKAGLSKQCGIFNVGSGTGHSLNQLCGYVRELTGSPLPVEYLEKRGFDVSTIILDISNARQYFDWSPRVDFREGLDRTWLALQPIQSEWKST